MTEVVRDEDSMIELKHINRKLSGLRTNLQSVEQALSNIQARVDKAMAEPNIWERIRQQYGRPFEQLDCGPKHGWSMRGGEPELRFPREGEWFLTVDGCLEPYRCIVSLWRFERLILVPVEPDVYGQIREKYGKPFEELQGPFRSDFGGWFVPLMSTGKPVFECAAPGLGMKECLTESGTVGCGYFNKPRLILRPAKRIVYIEDPNGDYRQEGGLMILSGVRPRSLVTHYRREEQG